jgi:biotin operon repressor
MKYVKLFVGKVLWRERAFPIVAPRLRYALATRLRMRTGVALHLKLYDRILDDYTIPRLQKQVLLYLVYRANESFKCWPSQRTIARQLGHSRQRICTSVVWLREYGFLTSQQKGRVSYCDMSLSATRYLSPRVTTDVPWGDTEVEVKKQTSKTPLPPTSVGEEFFNWRRETIGVRMGRRRRLPGLSSFDGAQAERVVEFLNQKGFSARIVRTQ